MVQIITSPMDYKNPILEFKRESIIGNPLIPITFGQPTSPFGIDNISKLILTLLIIVDIGLDYIGIKSIWTLILNPVKTFNNLMAVIDAVKKIVELFPKSWVEFEDLDYPELKALLTVILEGIQQRLK